VSQPNLVLAEGGPGLLQGLAIFALGAFLLAFVALLIGKLLRPRLMNPDKGSAYECGEKPVGPAWGQFDLRFYVVALVFLVFDVELALFYPWAVVFGAKPPDAAWAELQQVRWAALWDMLFFFGVIVVGFVYLWRFGYLDWVRSAPRQSEPVTPVTGQAAPQPPSAPRAAP